jgi:hypothetical protein
MLWNGADAATLPARAVCHRVAACLDSAQLTSLSIRDSIANGRRSASEHEIVAAEKRAGLHEWVRSLPATYDMVLSSAAPPLSRCQHCQGQVEACQCVAARDCGGWAHGAARALLDGQTMARPAAAAARAKLRVPRAAVRRGSLPGPGRQTKDLKGLWRCRRAVGRCT